jgi:hypothetical protein
VRPPPLPDGSLDAVELVPCPAPVPPAPVGEPPPPPTSPPGPAASPQPASAMSAAIPAIGRIIDASSCPRTTTASRVPRASLASEAGRSASDREASGRAHPSPAIEEIARAEPRTPLARRAPRIRRIAPRIPGIATGAASLRADAARPAAISGIEGGDPKDPRRTARQVGSWRRPVRSLRSRAIGVRASNALRRRARMQAHPWCATCVQAPPRTIPWNRRLA